LALQTALTGSISSISKGSNAGVEMGAEHSLSVLLDASGPQLLGTAASLSSSVEVKSLSQMTPKQILIISSRTLGKIVYTTLRNFKSKSGQTYALIDSGLSQPCAIAFDGQRSLLYVADPGVKAIFRYSIVVETEVQDDGETLFSLRTDGPRISILNGRRVEWLNVDSDGNLFYSSPETNSINKMSALLLFQIGEGMRDADSLMTIPAGELQIDAIVNRNLNARSAGAHTTTTSLEQSESILELYDGSITAHVSSPAGLVADNRHLFWANSLAGSSHGALIRAEAEVQMHPPVNGTMTMVSTTPPSSASILSNISSDDTAAAGVARSGGSIYWSTLGPGGGKIYGVHQDSGMEAIVGQTVLEEPRALVWDGDETMYVADEKAGTIWSFPAGRLRNSVPLTMTVTFQGAFGLALLNEEHLFSATQKSSATSQRRRTSLLLPFFFLVSFLTQAIRSQD
jgi:sugar lactone lactonase YvrE